MKLLTKLRDQLAKELGFRKESQESYEASEAVIATKAATLPQSPTARPAPSQGGSGVPHRPPTIIVAEIKQ